MAEKNPPGWKIKKCDNCGKKYPKGKGVTKIWLLDEGKYKDFPDEEYIGSEGIKELKGKSYCVLSFCCKKCFKEYLGKV